MGRLPVDVLEEALVEASKEESLSQTVVTGQSLEVLHLEARAFHKGSFATGVVSY